MWFANIRSCGSQKLNTGENGGSSDDQFRQRKPDWSVGHRREADTDRIEANILQNWRCTGSLGVRIRFSRLGGNHFDCRWR